MQVLEKRLKHGFIRLHQGDITQIQATALVTAANPKLLGGGGVDAAVHRAAGPSLLDACRKIGGCKTGSAQITGAFKLINKGVKHIIHAVGPVYQGGNNNEDDLLRGAYNTSLELADQNECLSVAFPSISTGVYGFPVNRAAPIAVSTALDFFTSQPNSLKMIIFCLFDEYTCQTFIKALDVLV